MRRFAAGNAPEIDRLVEDAIAKIGSEIASLRIPRLAGVVLGGGYGRGEGGVRELCNCENAESGDGEETVPEASQIPQCKFHDSAIPQFHNPQRFLSNDLDFYVVTEDGAREDDIEKIGEMLKPVSDEWTAKLGVDVDFCRAKTPWRLKHDEDRLMVQELVHGYVDVCGAKGEKMFAHVRRLDPSELPWGEAVRLLMNRGAGLLLAAEKMAGATGAPHPEEKIFIDRNINKCVLGAGDARLISQGRYRWKIEDRATALGDSLYSRAVEWKLRPKDSPVCDWETARAAWLEACDAIMGSQRPRRTLYQAARWLARRRTLGEISTFGLVPEVRIVRTMRKAIERRLAFSASLKKDWMIFN